MDCLQYMPIYVNCKVYLQAINQSIIALSDKDMKANILSVQCDAYAGQNHQYKVLALQVWK